MDLQLVTDLTESRMYRSKQAFNKVSARQVCDLAFMDMIAIWILYNEFDFAPVGRDYAARTVAFNRFTQFRQMSTDLYLNLHVVSEKRTDLLTTTADDTLIDRIQLDIGQIVRYLRMAAQNNLTQGMVRQTLQRLEQTLRIDNSNYRSVRRLAQQWPMLTTSQKRTVLTRMVYFYRANGLRSEMYMHINALAKSQGLIDPDAKNPERGNLAKTAATAAAAGAAGFAGGYHIGRGLV